MGGRGGRVKLRIVGKILEVDAGNKGSSNSRRNWAKISCN